MSLRYTTASCNVFLNMDDNHNYQQSFTPTSIFVILVAFFATKSTHPNYARHYAEHMQTLKLSGTLASATDVILNVMKQP